jgi:hypothetical protein
MKCEKNYGVGSRSSALLKLLLIAIRKGLKAVPQLETVGYRN